jgi:hypothetical protein
MVLLRSLLPSLLEQAMGCASSFAAAKLAAQQPAWPANPFPKGYREGSATEKAMAALLAAHPRWLEHWELMQITGRSRGAVTWGMKFLKERGLVMSIPSSRNPQYRRYRAVISVKE